MDLKIKLVIILACIILLFSGCSSDSGNNTGDKEKVTDAAEASAVLQTDNIWDGFNRIAVTFYGDTETQIGLSWYTPYKENYGNDVEVIEKKSMKAVDIDYEVKSDKGEYDENSMYHQTVIKGLAKDTEYYYRVGDKAADKWSGYGSFRTGSSDKTDFSFVAVTDTQSEHLPDAYFSAATMETAVKTAGEPAFIIHSGDFVDDGGNENQWSAQMNSAAEVLMNNVIVPAVGNHDIDDHSFWQHFMLEKTNGHKTTGLYYSYDYGNAHFVVLDTNKANETSYIDDEQLEWLDNDLKTARDKGAVWLIVNMHKGSYTVGEHAAGEMYAGDKGMRLRLGEIFEKHGVNLVLQGHDHCPSVTKPIKEGKASEEGVVYINTGSAGSKSYEMENNMSSEYYELFEYMDSEEREKDTYQNFAVITVSDNSLKVVMYERNIMKPEKQLYVLHEFEILK